MRASLIVLLAALCPILAGCTPGAPPTITPGSIVPKATGGLVVDIPIGTPPAGQAAAAPQPVTIGQLLPFRDDQGLFSIAIPDGWAATRQPPAQSGSDVRVGYLVQPLVGNAMLTVTQFDNGTPPSSLGQTINAVLKLTGWPSQPGYRELGRENVIGREGGAMRVEIEYERDKGVLMHSLALFQVDGTTFSMVNVAVDASSWAQNEAKVREMLATYRVPAEPAAPTGGAQG